MNVKAYNKPLGPTFTAELTTAGLDDLLLQWRSDGTIAYDDSVAAADITAVEVVVAAHNANAAAYVSAYVTAQGGNPATQSVPVVPGAVGATQPPTGMSFLAASVTLGGVTDTVGVHLASRSTGFGDTPCLLGSPLLGVTVGAGLTVYGSPGYSALNATENLVEVWLPCSTKIRHLTVRTLSAQPGTGSLVVTLRANGSDTGLAVTFAAGAAAGRQTDTVNTGGGVLGDRYSLKYVNNASGASAQLGSHSVVTLTSPENQMTPFATLLLALDQPSLSPQRVYPGGTSALHQIWVAATQDAIFGANGWHTSHLTLADIIVLQDLALTFGITL